MLSWPRLYSVSVRRSSVSFCLGPFVFGKGSYNPGMNCSQPRLLFVILAFLLASCASPAPSQAPEVRIISSEAPSGFAVVDGSRPLHFPEDLGAHEEFRTEWWYYTGNLQTSEGRHYGFELTIFRVGLLPPTVRLPRDSQWYSHSAYFAHFALSDVSNEKFHAFDRYSRPGPGLAGAQGDPYQVWLEDWNITEQTPGVYQLQATQGEIALDLTLTDEMGIVLHGENGYSRKGESVTDASYYYSQPRLRAEGVVRLNSVEYNVSGLAWNDHEFSSSELDENQVGWDWFSLQFESGPALMLFQLRERGGGISAASSGTFISADGTPQAFQKDDFELKVLREWHSPNTGGIYPAAWEVNLQESDCLLQVKPWMEDQEIHFPTVTYWEGAVHFEGTCEGKPVRGNGYVELTGYTGNLPVP